jgi:hypothetical protein
MKYGDNFVAEFSIKMPSGAELRLHHVRITLWEAWRFACSDLVGGAPSSGSVGGKEAVPGKGGIPSWWPPLSLSPEKEGDLLQVSDGNDCRAASEEY